ncbi:MAG: hypothetical protein RRA94_13850, partial [Bacteroidota bacterium]|nr:hypothetical protein [Bacteroidota bacterium]
MMQLQLLPLRKRAVLLVFAFSALLLGSEVLQAQTMMPLPAYNNTYNGMVRGYWFTAPTDFRIVGVRVPTDVGTAVQNVQVMKMNTALQAYPSTTTNYTTLGVWYNVNSTAMIPCDILVQTGDIIGIIGSRGSNGSTQANSYSVGYDPYTVNNAIFGQQVVLHRFGHQGYTYPVGAVWWEPNYQVCRVEMYYAPAVTVPNDVGIASIDSPFNFCAGNEDVIVTLKNFGTNQVTSATINWSLNGVPQTPYSWTGMLDTLNFNTRQTQVTLANMNFQGGVPYTIAAWTSMPNGVQDTVTYNDSSVVTRQAAIAGTYTIGGASPDYPDFTSAVNDLNQYGLCGPVVFNVRTGTYNEQIELQSITGASSINTVTFQSESGNSNDVNLTFAATGTANNYVVSMGDAEWVTFKDMTMTATGSSYGIVVYFGAGSTDCTFDNCELVSPDVNSTSTYVTVVYSDYGTNNHRTSFIDCGIREGGYGMYLYGGGTTSTEDDVLIQNCEFTGQYYRPVYSLYLGQIKFHDNRVIQEANNVYTYRYPAAFYYGYNSSVERNVFYSTGGSYAYGVYFYYENYYQSGSSRFVNNMISILNNGRAYYSVYAYRMQNTLFAHNTIHSNTTYTSSYLVYAPYAANTNIYNNIFYHTGGGYCWYEVGNGYVNDSDYNLWYTTGNNLVYWAGARANLGALQAYTGMDANSISKTVTFKDIYTGDLHLASPSDDDTDLFGTLLSQVTDDIDHEQRVNPYRGADEACYITPGSLNYSFVDGSGLPAGYAEAPGSIGVQYSVTFPEFAST